MRHTLIIITVFIALSSCQSKTEISVDKFQILLPDTLKTPRAKQIFERLKMRANQMNLSSIDTGAHDFEIRLWTSSMLKPDLLVIFKKSDTILIGKKIQYDILPDGSISFKADDTLRNNTFPLLADTLKKIEFSKLKSQNEIDGFVDNVADGITYHLEISTPKYYKLLTYHCPEQFANKDSQNKQFLEIILLLDRYLHFYSPICAPS